VGYGAQGAGERPRTIRRMANASTVNVIHNCRSYSEKKTKSKHDQMLEVFPAKILHATTSFTQANNRISKAQLN